jgi:hypothetical protein
VVVFLEDLCFVLVVDELLAGSGGSVAFGVGVGESRGVDTVDVD